jgi:hypothetical protein
VRKYGILFRGDPVDARMLIERIVANGLIGVKSRCAIHSGRVNFVMWLETAQSVR